jgi:DNA-binding XRE family transcriptional regulator
MTMATKRWADIKQKNMTPERAAENERWVQAELLQMSLRELREEASKTQMELAEAADMSQPQVSQLEKQENPLLTTVRRYVRALGGEVVVVAVMGNKRITIAGM